MFLNERPLHGMWHPPDLTWVKQQQQQQPDVEGGGQNGESQLSTILPPFSAPREEPHFKKLTQAGGVTPTAAIAAPPQPLLLLIGRAMTDTTSRPRLTHLGATSPMWLMDRAARMWSCEGVEDSWFFFEGLLHLELVAAPRARRTLVSVCQTHTFMSLCLCGWSLETLVAGIPWHRESVAFFLFCCPAPTHPPQGSPDPSEVGTSHLPKLKD